MGLVRFETLPDFNDGDYGFDDTDPRGPWQMVPLERVMNFDGRWS